MIKKAILFTGYTIFALIILVALIPACSSSPDTTTTTTAPASVSRAPTNTSASSLASIPISSVIPSDSMMAYFLSNGNLTIVTTAMQTTNLFAELAGGGPYTVFAPTNQAYGLLPPVTRDALFNDTAKLKQDLLYHIVKGDYPANKLTPPMTLDTLQGEKISVKISSTYQITINDAQFVLTDVPATNGVIHIIDQVLFPPSWDLGKLGSPVISVQP